MITFTGETNQDMSPTAYQVRYEIAHNIITEAGHTAIRIGADAVQLVQNFNADELFTMLHAVRRNVQPVIRLAGTVGSAVIRGNVTNNGGINHYGGSIGNITHNS